MKGLSRLEWKCISGVNKHVEWKRGSKQWSGNGGRNGNRGMLNNGTPFGTGALFGTVHLIGFCNILGT